MKINSNINILGSLPDWNLIKVFLSEDMYSIKNKGGIHTYTAIKTDKSVKRFERAIKDTFLSFENANVASLFHSVIRKNSISNDMLLLLFWNASTNNDLLHYLNKNVFFPAFYSGRVSIKNAEIVACIQELRQTEDTLKKWSEITIKTIASKYLTLLKKFGLMEGTVSKTIIHPHLNDGLFVLYIYWLVSISDKPNLISSQWLSYSFSEKQAFLDRLLQKKFSKYFNVVYTGDNLSIEPLIPYEKIYEYNSQS